MGKIDEPINRIHRINNAFEKNRKLSDEAERLFYDYTNKQSEYYAILFSDNFNEKKRKQIEAAEIELDKSRLNLRDYISHLETDLNSVIEYYEEEPDEPACILGDRVDELESRLHNMCVKVQVIYNRVADLEKKINDHVCWHQ